jgi:ATP-dependent DNA helicase RecQ
MPTGYGKSAIYQLAGAIRRGLSVVVSPLIALQRDQVRALGHCHHMPPAWAVNSTSTAARVERVWAAAAQAEHGYLFLTPEQLANEKVLERLTDLQIAQLVVDEAHCIAEWGQDFRPDYLRLGAAADRLGRPPVAALTATASAPVREEVIRRLGLREPLMVVRGFDRPNLHLAVRRQLSERAKQDAVVQEVARLEGAGLVYVATRRQTQWYAAALAEHGRSVMAYHGGMRAVQRRSAHEAFAAGLCDVVVATSAFGMGIDRADVRFVVHAAVPASPDSYYQEIGRAGRDGQDSRAVLFYRPEDFALHRFHRGANPDQGLLRSVFKTVAARRGVALTDLRNAVPASSRAVTRLVNLLEQGGALSVTGSVVQACDVTVDHAVELAIEATERRKRIDGTRMEMMRGYAEVSGCRREFLLSYLGEARTGRCGNCDVCDTGHQRMHGPDGDVPCAQFPVNRKVHHTQWGAGVVMRTEEDRLTVLFDREGYRTLSLQAVEADQLLVLEAPNAS